MCPAGTALLTTVKVKLSSLPFGKPFLINPTKFGSLPPINSEMDSTGLSLCLWWEGFLPGGSTDLLPFATSSYPPSVALSAQGGHPRKVCRLNDWPGTKETEQCCSRSSWWGQKASLLGTLGRLVAPGWGQSPERETEVWPGRRPEMRGADVPSHQRVLKALWSTWKICSLLFNP